MADAFFSKQRLRNGFLTYLIIAGEATLTQSWANFNGICRKSATSTPFRLDDMVTRGTLIENTYALNALWSNLPLGHFRPSGAKMDLK